ncbi:hypothetical protein [Schleiferilactobacillus shenzhenensis]|uniref:hypothetical protein n=1 Tax=Schleiferilactobacillus shenzhenensis TaxID=1231337 RepID=UPI0003FDAF24|nr:hypothetical protein [Schleiferilactobacillus shenzhenensis]
MKKWLLKTFIILSCFALGCTTLIGYQPPASRLINVQAADTAPTPPKDQTSNGWALPLLFGGWFIWNGLTAQPGGANFVVSESKRVVSFTSTYDSGVVNKITSVTTQIFRNGKWSDFSSSASWSLTNAVTPGATVNVDIGNSLPVGTYYFQFAVNYGTIWPFQATAYSAMTKVNILANPVPATAIDPQATPRTIFWGQSTSLAANVQPANTTADITWTEPSNYGNLSIATGTSTTFTSITPPTDAMLRNDSGLYLNIPAKATNDAGADPQTVSGNANVIVGGLLPQTTIVNKTISYKPALLDDVKIFPTGFTPSYQWTPQ